MGRVMARARYLYEKYKYFIFVNSSVVGPFMPMYCKRKWTDIFIEELNEQDIENNVKILGPTINASGGIEMLPNGNYKGITVPVQHGAHVQSYLFCIERNTLELLIQKKIFENENEYEYEYEYSHDNMNGNKNGKKKGNKLIEYYKTMSFFDAIRKEISMSRIIINNGWNIGSMLRMYRNVDFTFKTPAIEQYKKNGNTNIKFYGDIMYPKAMNNLWNQYDLIFFKGNR